MEFKKGSTKTNDNYLLCSHNKRNYEQKIEVFGGCLRGLRVECNFLIQSIQTERLNKHAEWHIPVIDFILFNK